MAFISIGYNPDKPMEDRITDIGPRHYDSIFPPVIQEQLRQMEVSRDPRARRSRPRVGNRRRRSIPSGSAAAVS